MGFFRFSKRIKILPGVSINLSKSGVSASVGPRGAKLNIGKRGVRANVGIPGTGMSYSTKVADFDSNGGSRSGAQQAPQHYQPPRPNPTGFAPRNADNAYIPQAQQRSQSAPEQEAPELPAGYPAETPAEDNSGCNVGCLATILLIGFGLFLLTIIAKG